MQGNSGRICNIVHHLLVWKYAIALSLFAHVSLQLKAPSSPEARNADESDDEVILVKWMGRGVGHARLDADKAGDHVGWKSDGQRGLSVWHELNSLLPLPSQAIFLFLLQLSDAPAASLR